jgi:hypothetical protein
MSPDTRDAAESRVQTVRTAAAIAQSKITRKKRRACVQTACAAVASAAAERGFTYLEFLHEAELQQSSLKQYRHAKKDLPLQVSKQKERCWNLKTNRSAFHKAAMLKGLSHIDASYAYSMQPEVQQRKEQRERLSQLTRDARINAAKLKAARMLATAAAREEKIAKAAAEEKRSAIALATIDGQAAQLEKAKRKQERRRAMRRGRAGQHLLDATRQTEELEQRSFTQLECGEPWHSIAVA